MNTTISTDQHDLPDGRSCVLCLLCHLISRRVGSIDLGLFRIEVITTGAVVDHLHWLDVESRFELVQDFLAPVILGTQCDHGSHWAAV